MHVYIVLCWGAKMVLFTNNIIYWNVGDISLIPTCGAKTVLFTSYTLVSYQ